MPVSTSRLERAFVMPFLAFLGVVGIHSLWRVVTPGFAPVWVGPLVRAGRPALPQTDADPARRR